MSDENEYSGSGHFVSGSEPEAPKAAKRASVADRQIVKNNGATVAEAKDVDQAAVGANAVAISDALGTPKPPIGDVVGGVVKELAPYVLGGLGLKAAWDVLSSNKSQTSNDGSKGGWDKTTAGKPADAKLGAAPEATPVPAAATTAAPIPETAPVAEVAPKAATALPAATYPATATQQPSIAGYGTQTINQPTGAPNVAVAPPADVAPVPVEPKPIDPYQQARIDKVAAETALINQRAAQEAERHQNNLAKDAERAVKTQQKSQGKPVNGLSNDANSLIADNAEGKIKADLVESLQSKPTNNKPIGGTSTPTPDMLPVGQPPAGSATPTAATTPAAVIPAPEKVVAAKQNIPGTESWLQGTWGRKKNPERAATLVDNLKATLPEGEKLSFPVGPDGKSLGGMPSRDHVMKFTNDLLGTSMDSKAFKEFRFTEENLAKMQDALAEKIKNAPSPEAAAKLQKGFATLSAMAATAGIALGGLALYGAYKKAKAGEYGEAAKLGIPAATGLVSPAIGGLTGAAADPADSASQLRRVAPILGTFSEIANQKMQQYLKKPKGAVPPPR